MKEYSKRIEILRAFAIFSVVCAHTIVSDSASSASSVFVVRLLGPLSLVGVPLFFFLSGYFFSESEDSFSAFWKKKSIGLMIPSVFCFTFLWLYVALRKGGFDIKTWIGFVIGTQSTAYYIVSLIVLYLLFWVGKKKKIVALIGIVLSLALYICREIFQLSLADRIFLSQYHNVLYWSIYFCLGMLISLLKKMEVLFKCAKRLLPLFALASIIILLFCGFENKAFTYFNLPSLIIVFILGMTFIGIASLGFSDKCKFIEKVGNYSFSIYLLHQFFSGLIIHVTRYADCWMSVIIRPFINIVIVMLVFLILERINNYSKGKLGFLLNLVGIKKKSR